MTPLSATIITYNEEKKIQACIESIEGIADEILVVDSGSGDRTVEIAEAKGARVEEHRFDGFVEQKNRAMELARYDLVLSIDADERLDDEAKASILRAKETGKADAYRISRLTNYCGKWIRHCGWYPDRKIRLWDRRKGKWTGMKVHEQLTMEEGATVGELEGLLLHYSYPSISSHVDTANRFSEWVAEELHQKGKKPGIFYHLLLNPSFTFFKKYVLKSGFRDGYYGFVISVISAYHNFLKYAKGRARFRKEGDQPSRDQTR
jgi:glycosyltransferase involved in cell wall biosynthesis